MSRPNLDDYVDVAERISEFAKKYPDGSLRSKLTRMDDGWLCRAEAYRTPDDARPGVGHAFEPVPGKTPFTRDSEAMNAETSAWGRAIVALGFQTKKIATREDVRNRQNGEVSAEEPKASSHAKGSVSQAARSEPASSAEPLATTGKKKKLDVLVGKLRGPHLLTRDLYLAVGLDADDYQGEDGVTHWSTLREMLTDRAASNLIDRLEKYAAKVEAEPVASRRADP